MTLDPRRVKVLKTRDNPRSEFVLYWMQASQRARFNEALEYAAQQANKMNKPLLVAFVLMPDYLGAGRAHYEFMFEGLQQTSAQIEKRGARFIWLYGQVQQQLLPLCERAGLLVMDKGYLKSQRLWRKSLILNCPCSVAEIEANAIVPVETASGKEEYSAATLRPKIGALLKEFIKPLRSVKLKYGAQKISVESAGQEAIANKIAQIQGATLPARQLKGGSEYALALLNDFIKTKLKRYPRDHNDPLKEAWPRLSPYLHFGQISPVEIALQVGKAKPKTAAADFLEELVVRRELAVNFVHYNDRYDRFDALPAWALRTLLEENQTRRSYVYSRSQFERAQTHDPAWNAAQNEMLLTGQMHGYMRMYWGKKILEWSTTPQEAFDTALALNDRYALDGRDPNGYAGVAWCFGKHDRPWGRFPVFGLVRSMTFEGLRRKFDVDAYCAKINNLLKLHPL